MRLPFFDAPLTADEGGYAEAARLWGQGATLYRDIWVDRPQGLILVFRGALQFGTSTEAIRAVAAAVGALSVLATMLLAFRLTGRRTVAFASGLLMATAGASPFLESFTLAGSCWPRSPRSCLCSPSLPTCARARSGGSRPRDSPRAARS